MGQSSPFAFVGGVIGAGIGSTLGPGGAWKGAQFGMTLGSLAGSIANKPKDAAPSADAHWGGVSFGTAIPRGWANHQVDCFVFWGVRNKNGSYLFKHDAKKRKKAGSQNVAHYRATFAFHILETGLTFPDGRQVERRIVVDRVWMADKIVWQSESAVPIEAYAGNESRVYAYGEYALDANGHTYVSIADGNQGHDPSASPAWWKDVSTNKNYAITIHPDPSESTFTQAVSSVIASHEGVANCDAKRGSTYGVADDIDLFDLGNALPFGSIRTDWHFADAAYTFGEFLSDVCGLSGMPQGSYDFSDVTELMPGYRQTARQSGQDLVTQPLSVLGYDLTTIDGVLRAVKRGGPVTATLSLGELGATLDAASIGDDDDGELIGEAIPVDRTDLHSSLKLGYFDRTAGYRQSFRTAVRNDHGGDNPMDLPTDLVLSPDRAAKAAGYLLDSEHLEAGADFGVSLLGQRSAIVGTDPLTVPYRGAATRFRVTKVSFAQNLVKLSLARDEPQVLVRHETGSAGLVAAADDGTIKPTAFVIASPPQDLSNDFASFPGFYVWVNGPDGWLGGQVVFTFDAPGASERDWVDGPFVSDASTFGVAATALANNAAGYDSSHTADVAVTIAAEMGVPASTLALVSNGAQNALLGNEFVGVVGASSLGGSAYRLGPGLVRGMRGSPTGGHAAGEPFAAAPTVAATTKVEVDRQYIGQTVYVRALSPGQDLDDSSEQSCVIASPTSPYVTSLPQWASETPVGLVNGTNATFTLAHAPIPGSETILVAGSASGSTAYALSGTTLTFATPPPAGVTITAKYQWL